jgi:cellulose synthase (UDP-forming)
MFKQKPPSKRRQWGAEKRTQPLSTLHEKPSAIKIASSRAAVVLTVFFWSVYFVYTIIRQFFDGPHSFQFTMQAISYLVVVTFLTFSALMYLIARQGAFQRFAKHSRVPRAKLEAYFATQQPSITVLVPSYAEEVEVIRKTLMSAFLQEYPKKKIVLLVDDNPVQNDKKAAEKLDATRALAQRISESFAEPRNRFTEAVGNFAKISTSIEAARLLQAELVTHYLWAASWLHDFAQNEIIEDHVDIFFADQVLRSLADELQTVGKAVQGSITEGTTLSPERMQQLISRLQWIFTGEVETFERKMSLSHEANKAMNLNAYIGLMGQNYQLKTSPEGTTLVPVSKGMKADLEVPNSDYVLTLDADSLLLRDYCLRLVYFLELPHNHRVGVVQTPYSAFRGAGTRIERLAGATTDIQHILHQGKTFYGATFWVGANAVIRKQALDAIVETEHVGGYEVKRYVQDRTVIEDTESSIDLAMHGWTLVNYPERLSYSATPPDFGSLIIQRRRWANGGLLIMPKLFARIAAAKRNNETVPVMETLLRINYMASITWASFGLLFLLAYPYDGRLLSPLVVLAAAPYFLCMASDLKYCGYKRSDIFRIYGFNLILLPVNLAGVLKSLQQALSGEKIPFARTPKVKNRTVSPLLFVVAPLAIVAFSALTFVRSYHAANWGNAAFALMNAALATWAIVSYIGIFVTIADIWVGLTDWLYVDTHKKVSKKVETKPDFNWRAVLYHGEHKDHTPTTANEGGL